VRPAADVQVLAREDFALDGGDVERRPLAEVSGGAICVKKRRELVSQDVFELFDRILRVAKLSRNAVEVGVGQLRVQKQIAERSPCDPPPAQLTCRNAEHAFMVGAP
jgi:hypothetical protein